VQRSVPSVQQKHSLGGPRLERDASRDRLLVFDHLCDWTSCRAGLVFDTVYDADRLDGACGVVKYNIINYSGTTTREGSTVHFSGNIIINYLCGVFVVDVVVGCGVLCVVILCCVYSSTV
jgi:hypothetical protein